jgi:type IX secretion system PorP/SprF family membrane protein
MNCIKTTFLSLFLKRLSLISVASLLSFNAIGQDIQFSQFYNVLLYQNPAFAGSAHAPRATLHQRLQWPAQDSKYTTSFLSVDHFFHRVNSGGGLLVTRDVQGSKNISSTDVGAQYAYELPLTRQLSFRAGLQLSYVFRNVDYAQLTFPQQYTDVQGLDPSATNPYASGYSKMKGYADVSSGGLLYSKTFWVGLATHHLNTPNQSQLSSDPTKLPMKVTLTGGYKIPLVHKKYMAYLEDEKEVSLTPTFNYKSQGKSDQLDLGAYIRYDQILFGFWYRGIPVKHYKRPDGSNLQNTESVVAMVGWKFGAIAITYSYDFVTSRLAPYRTGGAHELNLTLTQHKHKKKHKQLKRLPCPSFH